MPESDSGGAIGALNWLGNLHVDTFQWSAVRKYLTGIGVALALSEVLPTLPKENPIHDLLHSATAASWVQALGAVGALGIAIWLNRKDSAERRVERLARERNAGLTVVPFLQESHVMVLWALERLQQGKQPYRLGTDEDGGDIGLGAQVFRSKGMMAAFPYVAQLGPAAHATQLAFRALGRLESAVGSMYDHYEGEYFYTPEGVEKCRDRLRDAERLLRQAIPQIDNLITGP